MAADTKRCGFNRTELQKQTVLVLMAILCLCLCTAGAVTSDIEQLVSSADQPKGDAIKPQIVLQNALKDRQAVVGKVFKFIIPSDTFKGDVRQLTVTEGNGDQLPSWLMYDGKTHTLSGIPSHQDLGEYYIQVRADGTGGRAQDVFSISVVERTRQSQQDNPSANTLQPITCQPNEAVTMVTVVVDTDLNKLLPSSKVDLISKMVKHLKLTEDFLTMLPVGNKPLFDKTAIVAGRGDAMKPKHPGAFISWTIGCGSVHKDHLKILEDVESKAQNGAMSAAIGHNILGWHVTSNKLVKPTRRLKRQIQATATPIGPQVPPTKAVVPTMDVDRTKSAIGPIRPTRVQVMTTVPPEMSSKAPVVMPTAQPTPMRTADVVVTVKPTPKVMPTTPRMTPEPEPTTRRTPKMPTRPTRPTRPTKPTRATTPKPEPGDNTGPKVKNRIGQIPATVGNVFRFRIPKDTFIDAEDGNTRKLAVLVTTLEGTTLPRNFWLKYNAKKQELIGLPMEKDIGLYQLKVSAMDSSEALVRTALDIMVLAPRPGEQEAISHEFTMTLNIDYDTFVNDVHMQLDFLRKLGNLLGNKNGNNLQITGLKRGSVILSWTDTSLGGDSCNSEGVEGLLKKLMYPNGTFTPEAKEMMHPFELSSLALEPKGSCQGEFEPVSSVPIPRTEPEPEPTTAKPGKGGESKGDDDDLVVKVLPAVIIVALLLLAGIIACVLYRKRRQGKMKTEEQRTFVNKGIPIIFADELDDKAESPARPLIMDNEQPAQEPPAYHREGSNTPSTPPSDHKEPIEDDPPEDELEMENETLVPAYHPPDPPVNSEDSTLPRPRTEPSYQPSPPPYVPP